MGNRKEKGITLIALIITIIVLVILAAVTINSVYKSRIIEYAVNGSIDYTTQGINENKILGETEKVLDSVLSSLEGIGNTQAPEEPPKEEGKGPNGKILVTELKEIQGSKVEAEDKLGNAITMPAGFKYKEGEIAEKGIVIEDEDGNQFVWVPVSNTNHDGSNKIKKEDKTEVEITLGRYTFNKSTGEVNTTEGTYQYAANYANETELDSYFKELKDYRESNRKDDLTGTNTTAKDLKGFIDSTNANHGYYIARYEASYGSGYDNTKENPLENAKPLSKVSTAKSESIMNYTQGELWIWVPEPDAAKICQNMYSTNVHSDLVNSYAWDTAIVFIQEMEDSDYSKKTDGNGEIRDTGTTEDKVCNIFDMGGNLLEFTTEFSSWIDGSNAKPCVVRGGVYYKTGFYTSIRGAMIAEYGESVLGFRCLLYV